MTGKLNGTMNNKTTVATNGEKTAKDDLWNNAHETTLDNGVTIQIMGLKDDAKHIMYARALSDNNNKNNMSIMQVLQVAVDEEWKRVAKEILEHSVHVKADTYPPAQKLLELGSVWLLNETEYVSHHNAHAKRLCEENGSTIPNWKDCTLRIHYAPERFHAANEVDWGKPCRGLLVGNTVRVDIGGETPHVSVAEGLPDEKDGVVVYKDIEHGFAVLNKPENVPVHATKSNHEESLVAKFKQALTANGEQVHISVPQGHYPSLDTTSQGLIVVSTKASFTSYLSKLIDAKPVHEVPLFQKTYKCLVCVKDPDTMNQLEVLQGKNATITHYMDVKSPAPKRFLRHKPAKGEFQKCQMKITKVGDDKYRAACVASRYKDSMDNTLAQSLWNTDSTTPAQDLGISHIMELELQVCNTLERSHHQICGQLAALGFPVVGDEARGGGTCEMHKHFHTWNRLALQCNQVSFMEPKFTDKTTLDPSHRNCVFTLMDAWWSQALQKYERFHENRLLV